MAKTKTSFFCQNCGTQYAKWVGKGRARPATTEESFRTTDADAEA